MTSMAPEIEQVDLEDFEFERPCTPWEMDCPVDGVATWMLVSLCCGMTVPTCDSCKEYADELLEPQPGGIYVCGACNGRDIEWTWRRIK
jgi:hypothetical protein